MARKLVDPGPVQVTLDRVVERGHEGASVLDHDLSSQVAQAIYQRRRATNHEPCQVSLVNAARAKIHVASNIVGCSEKLEVIRGGERDICVART